MTVFKFPKKETDKVKKVLEEGKYLSFYELAEIIRESVNKFKTYKARINYIENKIKNKKFDQRERHRKLL